MRAISQEPEEELQRTLAVIRLEESDGHPVKKFFTGYNDEN